MKSKKILALALAVLMIAVVFSGCQRSNTIAKFNSWVDKVTTNYNEMLTAVNEAQASGDTEATIAACTQYLTTFDELLEEGRALDLKGLSDQEKEVVTANFAMLESSRDNLADVLSKLDGSDVEEPVEPEVADEDAPVEGEEAPVDTETPAEGEEVPVEPAA